MKKCKICESGKLEKVKDIILDISGYVFVLEGERCSQCKEEFPYENETQKVIEISRKLGVWPEPFKLYRHLSRSGKGLVFRVPADIEHQMNLKNKEMIAISKIGNKLVIEPL